MTPVALLRYFPFLFLRVEGASMLPSLHPQQVVFVSPLVDWFLPPKKGDVVVVISPQDGRLLIKRITSVVENRYTVEGDNTAASTDSRSFGPVPRTALVGKVLPQV